MMRLAQVMPAQQQAPMKMGLPPDFTSLTMSVLRPMAAMARMMKNLEEEDEEGEDLLDVEGAAGGAAAPLGLPGPPDSQHQRDGDDGQGPGQLDDGSVLQHRAVGAVESVPGGGRRRDGGGVVDGSAGKEAEALVAHTHGAAQGGEGQRRQDVEQEDHGDGLGDLLIVGSDDRGGGGDGAAAAYGRAHTHQHGDIGGNLHPPAQQKRDHQRYGNRGADNGQGPGAHLGNLGKIQSEAQQDHRVLQDLFGSEGDAGLVAGTVPQDQGHHHAQQDGDDRSADHRESAPQQPAGDSQDQAQQQSGSRFSQKVHVIPLSFSAYWACLFLIIARFIDKIK